MESRVLARTLPGILDSGLWRALAQRPPLPTRALITDVGNDILYGASPTQILAWVQAAMERLAPYSDDMVVTGLPLDSIRRLSPAKFLAFRTILFHRCRLPFKCIVDAAEQIEEGLAGLAASHGARFVSLRPDWYGFDPVHIRPGRWGAAWREILGEDASGGNSHSIAESLRLHTLSPERQRLFGVERVNVQQGLRLTNGGQVWLY